MLSEQTCLDYLVHVCAGEGKPGSETPLNFGEVVRPALLHFADHGINVLLRGDNDPCSASTDCAELLRDRLHVEHQVGVRANELADLINQEYESMIGSL